MASTRSVEDLGLGLPVSESRPPGAGAVTKKGWFQKRGQPPFTDFKTRFFVLQGSDVRYYASEDDYEEQAAPKGSFSCVGLRIVKGSVTAHSAQHGFHFVTQRDEQRLSLPPRGSAYATSASATSVFSPLSHRPEGNNAA